MKKRFLSLLCALTLCLGLMPATALAADGIELYVAGQRITESGCYENQNGTWTKVDGTEPANGQFYYDAATATLTLNEAKIVNYQDVTVGGGHTYPGSVIAFSQPADVSLTIVVSQGTSNITGAGGIRVMSETGDASLSISGPGSLEVNVDTNDSGISLIGSKNVNLNIDGADVKTLAAYYYGVDLHAGDGFKAAAVVNNGKLTAGGSGGIGIYYRWTNASDSGTSSLTVSGNAVVDTRDSNILIASQASEVQVSAGSDGNGGIVFDGKSGAVYGDVTLQEDLEIGTDETLTIGKDASLTVPDGKTLTNDGTITVESGGKLEGTTTGNGTLKIAPTITTQPQDVEVKENETATFTVVTSGTEPLSYQWQQSTDNGNSWTNIDSATSDTYTTGKTTMDMSGTQYRCVVSNSAGSVTSNVATLTVNKHVHTWGNPAWNWSEDGKTCTVTFTCQNDETHKEAPAVTVTSAVKTSATCTETGVTTYTATVELIGKTYTDTKDVADIPATGHSYENGKCTVCSAVDPAFKAMIIEGANGKWQKGSEDVLSFTSNAAFADFLKVQVDGKDLDASNYTVEEGSTIVALNASYLETLPAGKHTLAIVSDTGTAETEFTVVAAEKQPADDESANDKAASDGDKESLAKTGDGSMLPITVLSVLAVASIATGVFALRRSRI
ncbi:hypothetical protein [Enorma massiliensis]|uniref:hypothetical protein n=1 Tax=Enorma massiliensis TaxID=1472761 RepID=UPI0023F05F38|nr:hypothetical protein [Enorma massiliensis]